MVLLTRWTKIPIDRLSSYKQNDTPFRLSTLTMPVSSRSLVFHRVGFDYRLHLYLYTICK
jgi:hypothetical protein